jgi:Na+/H+ antiporter NhaD/arsenite permease-like protein
MAVAVLQEIGVLTALGEGLNEAFSGNYYVINGIIGVLSSIVDNVPLVAGCMGMYPVAPEGAMAVDGIFWQLLAYCAGVGGLCFVPIFKTLTHLPPFMGILLVLGILWTVTEIFHYNTAEDDTMAKRVSDLLSKIDLSTIMFFLGILMAVAVLQEVGVLTALGEGLNETFSGNYYVINGIIGVLSSIVDNVPLVAGCMGMYPVAEVGPMAVDGIFWQLLAYCAGVGGSMLIIGSAAGVVVMGLEKITFGWYLKKITWIAFVGYLAGIVCYWLVRMLLS